LVNITPITMVYGTYNELVTGANLNQLITGAPHIVAYIMPIWYRLPLFFIGCLWSTSKSCMASSSWLLCTPFFSSQFNQSCGSKCATLFFLCVASYIHVLGQEHIPMTSHQKWWFASRKSDLWRPVWHQFLLVKSPMWDLLVDEFPVLVERLIPSQLMID
jgi:hypothetical protein